MTQEDRIIQFIKENGSITQKDAYNMGIARLAARVNDLRRSGVAIKTTSETAKNQYGEPVRYARYTLEA